MSGFRDNRAFVTGGTGFVGSHLVDRLLELGFGEVRCLVRNRLKWLANKPITRIDGDLFNSAALREGCRDVDYVFHLAGVTGTKTRIDLAAFRRANVAATDDLVSAVRSEAPDAKKLVVTSSLAVIGKCEEITANEDTQLQPVSYYGKSKAEMEHSLSVNGSDIPFVIIRPPSVYGPREVDIYAFFKSVSRGIAPVLGSPDTHEVGLVHVRDLVRGMCMAAFSSQTDGKTYFLGNQDVYSWREIAEATSSALGKRALLLKISPKLLPLIGGLAETFGKISGKHFPIDRDKAREIAHACKSCSSDLALRDFGFKNEIGLQEGIQETINWYKKEGWL